MLSSGRSRPAGRPNDTIPRFDHKFIASTLSSKKIAKTNAARLLERLSAVTMAHKLGVDPGCVFKTLVARGDKTGVIMACIPAAAELNLKALATASGNKHVEMVHLKEVLPLTGYIRGGCSPLAAKKDYPVFLDEHAILWEQIYISAGQRGVQLCLSPDDLCRATGATMAEIANNAD